MVEVIVALALLGLILGLSGVAVASLREHPGAAITRQLIAARDSAIRSGKPFYFLPDMDFGPRDAIFAPFFGASSDFGISSTSRSMRMSSLLPSRSLTHSCRFRYPMPFPDVSR